MNQTAHDFVIRFQGFNALMCENISTNGIREGLGVDGQRRPFHHLKHFRCHGHGTSDRIHLADGQHSGKRWLRTVGTVHHHQQRMVEVIVI